MGAEPGDQPDRTRSADLACDLAHRAVGADEQSGAEFRFDAVVHGRDRDVARCGVDTRLADEPIADEPRRFDQLRARVDGLGGQAAVKLHPIDHIPVDAVPADSHRRMIRGVDDYAPDGVQDEIVADLGDVDRPGRDEARAVARLADLAVLLEDPDLEADEREVAGDSTAGGARADDENVS